MIRTQAQLSEDQLQGLRELAALEGVSVAELIRRGVDRVLAGREEPGIAERRRRALAVVGSFSGDTGDVSLRHDDYFVEAATAKR